MIGIVNLRRFVLAAVLIAFCAPLPAQAGEVVGKVFDARGRPAAGVMVELAGQQTVSAADGSYTFSGIPAGEQGLVAGSQAVAVAVTDEGVVRRNLFLLSREARAHLTGEAVTPLDNSDMLAASLQLAQAMLAEAEGTPARQLVDLGG
jgi:hypothetical protein